MNWFKQVVRACCFSLILLGIHPLAIADSSLQVSSEDVLKIAVKIWYNESGASVAGLTSWNSGENFASVGVGHFNWYPAQKHYRASESFPQLIKYMEARGVPVPMWLQKHIKTGCPWHSRLAFLQAQNTKAMRELRQFLLVTIPWQAEYMVAQMNKSLPHILASVPIGQQEYYRQQFYRIAASPQGIYALVDYVNFKGDGAGDPKRGWGLLQVLSGMRYAPSSWAPLQAFAWSANKVLTQRVENALPSRDEKRWLPGWRNRLRTYASLSISSSSTG